MVLYFTRGTTLWFDDWNFALYHRGGLHSLLENYNDHLSLVPILIYRALFTAEGIGSYLSYRVVLAAGVLLCGTLVFVYARRRVGAYLGLLAALLILFLGPGWQDILWPFQIGWLVAVAAGLGALLMLDRGDRLGDVAACVLLTVSVASSSVGVAVLAGAVVEIGWRRRSWRGAWIPGIPIVLYALWSLVYQHAAFVAGDIFLVPGWIASSLAASVSVPLGLSGVSVNDSTGTIPAFGFPLALIALVLVTRRARRPGGLAPRAVTLATIAVVFMVLTAVGRGFLNSPYPSRYVYVDSVFVLLFAVEVANGARVRRPAAIVLGIVCAAALLSNLGVLRSAGGYLRAEAPLVRASITALDIGRSFAAPQAPYLAFPENPWVIVRPADYFAMQRAIGAPTYTIAQLAAASEPARETADAGLIELHRVALAPVAPGTPGRGAPAVDSASGGAALTGGDCVTFTPSPVIANGATVAFACVTLRPAGSRSAGPAR